MRFRLFQQRSLASAQLVDALVLRADGHREANRFIEAAVLYGEALVLAPSRADLHIQRGHMLKEAGNLDGAGASYDAAFHLTPDDADLALQRGHFFKISGNLQQAATAYRQALALLPHWREPVLMLEELKELDVDAYQSVPPPSEIETGDFTLEELDRLVPALAPCGEAPPVKRRQRVEMRRLGREEPSAGGIFHTLRGVEALRGFCVASKPITSIEIRLNGGLLHTAPAPSAWPLPDEHGLEPVAKYPFNIWLDCSDWPPGIAELETRCVDAAGETLIHHMQVRIALSIPDQHLGTSDGFIDLAEPDPARLEAHIRALPSVVRPAKRSSLPPLNNILVLRTDQLGDMVSSISAIRRLRTLAPAAQLIGLVTTANADFAETLALFDELIVIDFFDDPIERRRLMSIVEQEKLRRRLAPYAFDLAIDLAESSVSRELLLLSGAKVTHGVGDSWPWLTSTASLRTHDRHNGLDCVPHSAKTLALVNALAGMIDTDFRVERRQDLDRQRLIKFGLDPADRYVLLHAGARIAFSRWPHFALLAQVLLERTTHHVVLMNTDRAIIDNLSTIPVSPRLHYLEGRVDFDDFDTLISFSDVVVGNDSGPKHLASLRGVHVVTLFCARINWMEWGQEEVGVIISRRVPCAGCAIFHDAEECAKDFTCIRDIAVEEVFSAMKLDDLQPSIS